MKRSGEMSGLFLLLGQSPVSVKRVFRVPKNE